MPKRRKNKEKRVKPVFRIFCEGEKTEPLYFKGLKEDKYPEHRSIIVIEDTDKNTPVQLVEQAIKSKKAGVKGDEVWVVYDRESPAKYEDELHHRARQKAEAHGINIGFSNVCFEYWILLHFQKTTTPYSNCADLEKHSGIKEYYQSIGLDYDKVQPELYDKIKDKVAVAIDNAKRINQQSMDCAEHGKTAPYQLNPYVDVYELLDALENYVK
ncbi:RloB family protein [Idiomarina sp. HB]|uniref:RloB family protein n=1 Tax=Idiomarina sp. HB TaxID=3110479 RepID=UPI003A7FEEB2